MVALSRSQFGGKTPLPLGEATAHQFEPVPAAQRGAAEYTQKVMGRPYEPPNPQLQVDPQVGFHIQREYRQHQAGPTSPRTKASYQAMASEVGQQYEHMTKPASEGGLGVVHEVTKHDPYATPAELAADVRQGRIKTLATASTGRHAHFTNLQNDQFRAVHDVFGHAATGRGFSRHGEEAAWQSHVQMFSPEAREAMTSETRGQNSFLNYNPERSGFPEQGERLVGMSALAQSPTAGRALRRRPTKAPAAPEPQLF